MRNDKIIIINLNNIDSLAIYGMIRRAINARKRKLAVHISMTDFCKEAGISRTQVYGYARGEKAGKDGVIKVANGLRAWGYHIEITI